jgi:hypothetical protein
VFLAFSLMSRRDIAEFGISLQPCPGRLKKM